MAEEEPGGRGRTCETRDAATINALPLRNTRARRTAGHLGDEVQYGVQLVPVGLKRHHHAAAHNVERLLKVAHHEHLGRLAAHVEEVDVAVIPERRDGTGREGEGEGEGDGEGSGGVKRR